MVLPVNYLADEDAVVFCTAEDTILGALPDGSPVAFEVDESHPLERTGVSVVVRGPARTVTDPGEVEALQRGPLHTWAPRAPQRWVRIGLEEITGRRLGWPDLDLNPGQIAARKMKPSTAIAVITSRAVMTAQATLSRVRTTCAMEASSIAAARPARVPRHRPHRADGRHPKGRSSRARARTRAEGPGTRESDSPWSGMVRVADAVR